MTQLKPIENPGKDIPSMDHLRIVFLFSLLAFLLFPALQLTTAQEVGNQLTQKGDPHQIPGCGVSGCYQPYDICVDVPPGAVPLSITRYYDSFSGWGEFINPRKTATGFCASYVQHSHNVTRIVSFDVLYQLTNLPGAIPLSATEESLLARAKLGEPLKLSGSAQKLSGAFLQAIITQGKGSEALKMRGLEIEGAEFSDTVMIAKTSVPFSIRLTNCRFAKPFFVQDARFDGSLVIEDGSFEGSCVSTAPTARCYAFEFQNTTIKEDLIVKAKPSSPDPKRFFDVTDTRVEGRTELTMVNSGLFDNLKTGDLHITAAAPIDFLNFVHLDVDSFRMEGAVTHTQVKQLYTSNSKIHNSLRIEGIAVDEFRTVWTAADELILSNIPIAKGFNLSFSTLNSLQWAMGQNGKFPPKENNDLTGVAFKNLRITHADAAESAANSTTEPKSNFPDPSDVAKTSLQMLDNSPYSASAYDALEKLLASRGDPQADEVFQAGREARRRSEIGAKPILGRFQWCLDLFQEYVLGYGRFARWPILWSVVVILVGFGFFWNESDMERKPEADSNYSRYWYSFELFVPVLEFGVASQWHPKPQSAIIANYARLHKLAGWILVPVMLAALTGFGK